MLKKPNNPGLKKLPRKVRNKMGFAKKGGNVQSKLKEIIQDENQVDFVIQYLKDKREVTVTNDLRKIHK